MAAEVHLVGELGAFPAPLVRLIWALARQRGVRVARASILTHATGVSYLDSELHPALGELSERLGGLAPGTLDVVVTPLPPEIDAETSEAWNAARWAHYSQAVEQAGEYRLVFALVGGRQRASSAMAATMYSLLARGGDVLIDVRVDHPGVEGHTASPIFYHPEQGGEVEDEYRSGERVAASAVAVHLIELPHPRIRALFGPLELPDFPRAVRMATARVDAAGRPELWLDLARRRATWGGVDLGLGVDHIVVLAALAEARQQGDGWSGTDATRLCSIIQRTDAAGSLRNHGLKALAMDPTWDSWEKGAWLSGSRSRLARHLRGWFDRNDVVGRELLAIEKRHAGGAAGRWHEQRLRLSADRIRFADAGPVPLDAAAPP